MAPGNHRQTEELGQTWQQFTVSLTILECIFIYMYMLIRELQNKEVLVTLVLVVLCAVVADLHQLKNNHHRCNKKKKLYDHREKKPFSLH